ncbi:aminoglycoside phosphotransferase family protein [Thalassobacillus hwangdonensis]|uniref:Aminoglycoside phosphotransferase family protein n=1 Tax=Thalassobacillus hwangdonensis TaxID=546108 RepID=A0ABW3L0G1_9BACI
MDVKALLQKLWESPIEELTYINKGFSPDEKYRLQLADGERYFIKLCSKEYATRKQEEFTHMKNFKAMGVPVPEPIFFYTFDEAPYCVQCFEYIDGKDGEDALPEMTEEQQYNVGVQAGRALRKINTVPLEHASETWESYRMNKYDNYMLAVKDLKDVRLDLKSVDAFVQQHKHLLKNRPLVFNHDDFHPCNLMVSSQGLEAVIDFDRFDWEDPYHEFYKMALFSRNISVPFCVGQVHGYFDDEVPEDFWDYYALYAAMTFAADIVWSTRFSQDQIEHSYTRLSRILEDHDHFKRCMPKWYAEYDAGEM